MNTTRISSVFASGALALGLCATAAAQASADATISQAAGVKAPVTQQAKSTVTHFTDIPACASKVIGTDLVYASGAEFSIIRNLVVSATSQVVAILERPDGLMVAVPLSSLEPRLKNVRTADGKEFREHKSDGRTSEVERFTLRCARPVCDSAPTVKDVELIDGAWLARSVKHFTPVTTPAPTSNQQSADSRPVEPVVADARAPIFLKALMGQTLETSEGVELGEIDDVALDLGTGMVSYVIVSAGGPLGVGESLHAIEFDSMTLNAGSVNIMMNKDSFSKLPDLDIERLAIDPVGALAMRVDLGSKVADRNQRN
jgi:sporulation protein YlmC with PRC-barrel domain